jgi:prepilin-type processing-associated H-X9-DG protein
LLPAVQKVREAAARTSCQNKLRQIALALHSFENVNGFIQGSVRTSETGRQGWSLFLLPYFEQTAVFGQFDFTKGWNQGANNSGLVGTRMSTFECPSTPNTGRLDAAPEDPNWLPFAASADYATINGVDSRLVNLGLVDNRPDLRGIMPRNLKSKLRDVSDGLSNTLLFVESAGRPQIWRAGSMTAGTPPQNRVNGGGWCRPASDFELKGASPDGLILPGPVAINATNGEDVLGQYPHAVYGTLGTGETYSFHTGGANVAFGDCSVRLIRSSIPISTFAAQVTRAGREAVSEPD